MIASHDDINTDEPENAVTSNYCDIVVTLLFNVLVNLWELEILPCPLIEYHRRKLFIGHELYLFFIYLIRYLQSIKE